VADQDGQRGERGGGDHAQGEDQQQQQQQQQPAHLAGCEAGPVLAWNVPDLGHGMLAAWVTPRAPHRNPTRPTTSPTALARSTWMLSWSWSPMIGN